MPLKIIIAFLVLLIINPTFAKEKDLKSRYELSSECPIADPLCKEIAPPNKTGSQFEKLSLERVIDGDTILADGRKIRIWGIDAPEKDEPGYLAASWLLDGILKDGDLTCKLIDLDKYRREVMHCLIDGLDIAGMMVKAGMAKDFSKYSGGYYKQEERSAKAAKRGIWKLPPR